MVNGHKMSTCCICGKEADYKTNLLWYCNEHWNYGEPMKIECQHLWTDAKPSPSQRCSKCGKWRRNPDGVKFAMFTK